MLKDLCRRSEKATIRFPQRDTYMLELRLAAQRLESIIEVMHDTGVLNTDDPACRHEVHLGKVVTRTRPRRRHFEDACRVDARNAYKSEQLMQPVT